MFSRALDTQIWQNWILNMVFVSKIGFHFPFSFYIPLTCPNLLGTKSICCYCFSFCVLLIKWFCFLWEDTSAVPPLLYAVMGTSRDIAIGPVAIVSLLLSSMVQKIADPAIDPALYRKMIFTVTFLTGVFQFAFGLFRYRAFAVL